MRELGEEATGDGEEVGSDEGAHPVWFVLRVGGLLACFASLLKRNGTNNKQQGAEIRCRGASFLRWHSR